MKWKRVPKSDTLPVENFGYGLWAGMQVPLFVLIQTFHFYKKEGTRLNIKKIIQRVLLPFVIIGLIEFIALCFINTDCEYKQLALTGISNGGGTALALISQLFIFK